MKCKNRHLDFHHISQVAADLRKYFVLRLHLNESPGVNISRVHLAEILQGLHAAIQSLGIGRVEIQGWQKIQQKYTIPPQNDL